MIITKLSYLCDGLTKLKIHTLNVMLTIDCKIGQFLKVFVTYYFLHGRWAFFKNSKSVVLTKETVSESLKMENIVFGLEHTQLKALFCRD
jgi:hypothetical protein